MENKSVLVLIRQYVWLGLLIMTICKVGHCQQSDSVITAAMSQQVADDQRNQQVSHLLSKPHSLSVSIENDIRLKAMKAMDAFYRLQSATSTESPVRPVEKAQEVTQAPGYATPQQIQQTQQQVHPTSSPQQPSQRLKMNQIWQEIQREQQQYQLAKQLAQQPLQQTTVQQQPAPIQQQPAHVQQQPTPTQQQPTSVQQQPAPVQQQPTLTQQQPAPIQQQPTLIQYQVSQSEQQQKHQIQPQQQQQQQQQPTQPVAPSPEPSLRSQERLLPPQQTPMPAHQQPSLISYAPTLYHHHSGSPLYYGHNPFIEILRPHSYADDNIVTLNLSHSHIYEIDSDAFVGQRFEHIDLSNNKLGLIHSRSFRIGPNHSRHNPYNPHGNSSKQTSGTYPTRRPPPAHPKSVTIDFSHNMAIVALSGAFDHIDVPNCLLNFTNSKIELKFGAFKKYFKEHPGHIVDIESVDCCEQEWLLGYKHNFVTRTYCEHDPNLFLSKVPQQVIIDSCIAYVTAGQHSHTLEGPGVIQKEKAKNLSGHSLHTDNQYLTYLILGGTAMILTSLSIYIIFYMFSLKAAFVYQMQNKC